MDIRIQCLCVDSPEPQKIASFWEAALGWRRTFDEEDQIVLEPPEGSPEDGIVPGLLFLRVPEPKAAKNRMHFDLRAPGAVDDEVLRIEDLGASVAQRIGGHTIMNDPEGNVFCVEPGPAGSQPLAG